MQDGDQPLFCLRLVLAVPQTLVQGGQDLFPDRRRPPPDPGHSRGRRRNSHFDPIRTKAASPGAGPRPMLNGTDPERAALLERLRALLRDLPDGELVKTR
jgi:hypothetical protein